MIAPRRLGWFALSTILALSLTACAIGDESDAQSADPSVAVTGSESAAPSPEITPEPVCEAAPAEADGIGIPIVGCILAIDRTAERVRVLVAGDASEVDAVLSQLKSVGWEVFFCESDPVGCLLDRGADSLGFGVVPAGDDGNPTGQDVLAYVIFL